MTAKSYHMTHGSNICRNVKPRNLRRITPSPANGTRTITAIMTFADTRLLIIRKGGGLNQQGLLRVSSGLKNDSFDALRSYHLTRTELFIAISLLATAEYNLNPSVLITWCNKGRWKREHHRITGMMTQDMPAFLNIEGLLPEEIASSVRQQVKGCMLHRDYPYALLNERMLADENLCLIYQGRIFTDAPKIPLCVGFVEMRNKYAASENILDIEVRESDSGIDLLFVYNAGRYKAESIERFAGLYVRILHDALKAVNADA